MLSAYDIGLRQGDGVAGIEVMGEMAKEVESIISGTLSPVGKTCRRLKVFRG